MKMKHMIGWMAALAILVVGVSSIPAQGKAQTPFNGKNLLNWRLQGDGPCGLWTVGVPSVNADNPEWLDVASSTPDKNAMVNVSTAHGQSLDIHTVEKFGDSRIEVELLIPKGSNSGVYVMGEYEVQVFDSYGKEKIDNSDMGAIYGASPPPVNACKAPGEWQKYVIEYRAPKFDAEGKKISNMVFLKVELNGKVLHENLEMSGPTPGGVTGKEASEGPLMFQGNHGPVAYRNIQITPLEK